MKNKIDNLEPEGPSPLVNNYYYISKKEALDELGTNLETGLADEQVIEKRKIHGLNELQSAKKRSIWRMIWDQLKDVMILVLFIAAALSFAVGYRRGHFTESIVILAIIVINTVIGVIQEKRANNAIESLKSMSAPQARVLRNGEEDVIPASELVPGDIVFLEDGTIIPADIRLIESYNLKVSEASLTGESLPIEKDEDSIISEETLLGDRLTMTYASSTVVYGTGFGVVTQTGMRTEVGKIAGLLSGQPDEDSLLKKKLNRIGKILSITGIIIAIIVFVVMMSYGNWVFWDGDWFSPAFEGALVMALALAISVIPEGLPATATIVMALGVQRMAKENALVRKLPAVETLGSASVICTDKTGTLTINRMTVTEIAINGNFKEGKTLKLEEALKESHKDSIKQLINCAALCNNATRDPDDPKIIHGDPTEAALLNFALKFGVENEDYEDNHERLFEQPFDSERKRMSTVNKMEDGNFVFTKGAVEDLLPLCTHISTSTGVRKITQKDIDNILKINLLMSRRALRVLGYAYKKISKVPEDDHADLENNLIFVGVTGMIDPPRVEVKDAIQTCHEAGIKVIMITGDHRITATSIARQLGILSGNNTVIDGDDLDDMSDKELRNALKNATVFARVSASDKLRIIDAFKANGEVVAMTGDGVNDSPALRAADIGISMGITGTDVAKDASDMVLMNDNFTTIEYAVREGRRVYRNIQKVIQFLLAGNIAEVLTIVFAAIAGLPQPINAAQILIVNLVTDTLPALALGVDPTHKNIMKEKPIKSGSIFDSGLIGRVVFHGLIIAIVTLAGFFIGLSVGFDFGGIDFTWTSIKEIIPVIARPTADMATFTSRELSLWSANGIAVTMAFGTLALSQLIHSVNQRSNKMSLFSRGNGHNKPLIIAVFASLAILAGILLLPINNANGYSVFGVVGFYGDNSSIWWLYLVIIALSIIPTMFVEIQKLVIRGLDKRSESKKIEKDLEAQALRDTMKSMIKEAVKEANEETRIINQLKLSAKDGEVIYDENGEVIE